MSNWKQGEQRTKTFYITDADGNAVSVTDVVGVLYEVKTNKVIQRFDEDEANPSPEYIGDNKFKFTFTPAITRLCPLNTEIWFDILVNDIYRIYRGKIGYVTQSPLSNG